MRTATMASVFALLALSSYPVSAGDWNGLGRFSRQQKVTVHLKNGQEMKGTIQQVDPGSLQLGLGESRIKVATKELAGAVDKGKVGQVVELTTRDGQPLKGVLHDADPYYVYLDEVQRSVRIIPREEIQRITWRSRKLGALIGLGIGAGGATAASAGLSAGAKPVDLSRGQGIAVSGILFGLVGTAAGAAIGVERTLYKTPAAAPTPRR